MQHRNKTRNIGFVPGCTRFAAQGGSEETGDVTIGLDMIEAMRLVDAENLSQQEAAARMGVSTPTLCRILGEARRRTITALLAGQNILIEGGNIMLTEERGMENRTNGGYGRYGQQGMRGNGAGYGRGRGQGHGQGHHPDMKDNGTCSGESAMSAADEPSRGPNGHCHGRDHDQEQGHHGMGPVVHYHYHYHYNCAAPGDSEAPRLAQDNCAAQTSQERQGD